MYYHMATQTLTLIIVCSLADRNPDGGINATNHSDGIGVREQGGQSLWRNLPRIQQYIICKKIQYNVLEQPMLYTLI